mmetsp:Transcript_53190/g.158498  ORF Transcript_53190/g.158498 Transcript_53190/m.158498 type:complete len:213 (+) Transcript_53190:481-1119(+)
MPRRTGTRTSSSASSASASRPSRSPGEISAPEASFPLSSSRDLLETYEISPPPLPPLSPLSLSSSHWGSLISGPPLLDVKTFFTKAATARNSSGQDWCSTPSNRSNCREAPASRNTFAAASPQSKPTMSSFVPWQRRSGKSLMDWPLIALRAPCDNHPERAMQPAKRRGKEHALWRATAAPWEKPPINIRPGGTPQRSKVSTSAWTAATAAS